MKKLVLAIPILLLIIVMSPVIESCSENNCPLYTIALAHFDFRYEGTTSTATLSAFDVTGFITADVTVSDTLEDGTITERVVQDSILSSDTIYTSATTSMSLPLSYSTKTTYVLHYTEKMRDTIELVHQTIPYLENIECGTMMFYTVEEVNYTTNNLTSIEIVNPDINNEEKRNFYIYYTKDSDDE